MTRRRDALLRDMLRRPEPPPGMDEQLKANLRVQARAEGGVPFGRPGLAAAVLLLAASPALYLGLFPSTGDSGVPALVAAAREHAAEETALQQVESGGLRRWLRTVGAAAPPSERLVLFKTCVVDGLQVKHLRLRLDSGGTVDLMVDASGRWQELAPAQAEGWQVAHLRNVSLIMFHAPHHASEAARTLEALFPAAGASVSPKTEV